jgi:putative transposase
MSATRNQRRRLLQVETKYGGMEAADIRRLRELEEENRRLKHIVRGAVIGASQLERDAGKEL